ncbi:MAG: hypothetical protein WHU95_06325 [candidate division WOR-3 bacterium]|nr:hypothetical protein [candidate division WOR-3 bacterium]MDH7519291.1 hypothetical protein [bacterium]
MSEGKSLRLRNRGSAVDWGKVGVGDGKRCVVVRMKPELVSLTKAG